MYSDSYHHKDLSIQLSMDNLLECDLCVCACVCACACACACACSDVCILLVLNILIMHNLKLLLTIKSLPHTLSRWLILSIPPAIIESPLHPRIIDSPPPPALLTPSPTALLKAQPPLLKVTSPPPHIVPLTYFVVSRRSIV